MTIKTREELIRKYIDFFKSKNHKEIPSASLIPENDPTVLFTTAGMHPLVPYLLGQKHPLGNKLVNVQKCIRTGDIEEVGDATHHTFFEMLGNWSIGDYWKKEAIEMTFEFHTKTLDIPLERYAVTCFGSDPRESSVPKDEESKEIWLSLGIPEERIAFLPGGIYESKNNWWGPAGTTGPCGPDTEQFYWSDDKVPAPKKFDPKNPKWVEIGNDVLMQYVKNDKGKYIEAKQKNIDFGGGVERTLALLNKVNDNYLTSAFRPVIEKIESLSKKSYEGNERPMRIIADHIRTATFILGDPKKIQPNNTGQGYVLRRLIRRAVRYGKGLGMSDFTPEIAKTYFPIYTDYPELEQNKSFIEEQLKLEEQKFNETLEQGLKQFEKISKDKKEISGKDAFLLFQSYGFPLEMTEELALEKSITVKIDDFKKEFEKHQELSRTASSGQFKSGLQDNSQQTTKLHTATHLLNQALREVISKDIAQRGSNINSERLRFDFNLDHKMSDEEKQEIENWVNTRISEKLEITKEEMPPQEALKQGAQGEFGAKYPDIVSVYTISNKSGKIFSKEICTGPHVSNTSELGHFKILKEESSSAGIRRIKAKVEDSN